MIIAVSLSRCVATVRGNTQRRSRIAQTEHEHRPPAGVGQQPYGDTVDRRPTPNRENQGREPSSPCRLAGTVGS